MVLMLTRRFTFLTAIPNSHFLSRLPCFCLSTLGVGNAEEATELSSIDGRETTSAKYSTRLNLSPLFSDSKSQLESFRIDLVDDETWRVSSGLAETWRRNAGALETFVAKDVDRHVIDRTSTDKEILDFDEIEDMRIRGNLFYKLDRDSKEYEEYSFDFHRRQSSKKRGDQTKNKRKEKPYHKLSSGVEKSLKNRDEKKQGKTKADLNHNSGYFLESIARVCKNDHLNSSFHVMDRHVGGKKLRTPTFNQLTAPYHIPFCLDIYISKASVRACVIHRATSKVVAVAHSISKDMKFDLGSTKNKAACAAVGEILAQRALADDIHNVIYTPRKGEKLEGKIQIVLKSIVDNGVDVKVKLKQKKFKKASFQPTT